jgi:tetratricopeptide (TPR) repeat protein
LDGERFYRRLAWDSALTAYTRAVEADSTFALAHLRRAEVYGWTGGYGSKQSHDAVAAGVRFAGRLGPRDRRLLVGYQLFDQGKPAAIDSLSAFVANYPDDVEGWYLLGESLFHIRAFRPVPPDSVSAVFDSVLRRDSTLFPALLHPLDLALLYRDKTRYSRYFPAFARTAPPDRVTALQTAAGFIWGPPPTTKAIAAALAEVGWLIESVNSVYRENSATSDTLVERVARAQQAVPPGPQNQVRVLGYKAPALAGLGRWREASLVIDTLQPHDPQRAMDVRVWSVVLGLAPASPQVVDSAVVSFPPGGESEYAHAMLDLLRGRVAEGRTRIARTLAARDAHLIPQDIHGLLVGADGLGLLLQGDSAAGIPRLRSGLDIAAAPGTSDETAYLRFQLALALAANPSTREEGIRRLRYGFDFDLLYLPLTDLALGHTYEAAGQSDSAAQAYGRFLRLWDKADPELQGRVREAKAALQELSRERPH